MFMIRYNAAQPGAESDIFPHLERRKPMIVAYTRDFLAQAAARTQRLDRQGGHGKATATASVSQPARDVVLSAPKTVVQVRENLAALENGPFSEDEMTWMRDLGRAVHG